MAPKLTHREGPSVVRPDSPFGAEISWSSSSSDDGSITREAEDYAAELSDDVDSVDILVKREGDEIPFMGGGVCGIAASLVETLAAMSGDPDMPFFTTDVIAPRVRTKDIVPAVREGHIDGTWFDYLLLDVNFRTSLPPTRCLPVYTQAITAGMTIPIHPFVKDYCYFHGILQSQLASNFWYCFTST